jgi:beta-N-acetylhexosaminidase
MTRDSSPSDYDAVLRQAVRSQLVVVAMYVTAVSYQGSVAIPEETVEFVQALVERGIPHVVVSFGNPYLLADFPDVQAYMLAWSGTEVSQRAAYQALFGQFPIKGRTPTRIPPSYAIGDGIQLDARAARGR